MAPAKGILIGQRQFQNWLAHSSTIWKLNVENIIELIDPIKFESNNLILTRFLWLSFTMWLDPCVVIGQPLPLSIKFMSIIEFSYRIEATRYTTRNIHKNKKNFNIFTCNDFTRIDLIRSTKLNFSKCQANEHNLNRLIIASEIYSPYSGFSSRVCEWVACIHKLFCICFHMVDIDIDQMKIYSKCFDRCFFFFFVSILLKTLNWMWC